MNERRASLRLQVAQGHFALGEFDEAFAALSRGLDEAPDYPPIAEFVQTIEGEPPDARLAEQLAGLRARVAPVPSVEIELDQEVDDAIPTLSSSTLAELLAQQGHARKALRVAEEVLRRNPEDERARAVRERLRAPRRERERWIAELERWLGAAKSRRQQKEAHG